jgi:basic amino acid/polyamine antiporter, APA family
VLQIVPYFMTGFESVPKCSEEAHESFNPLGFVKAIFLALAVGTTFYVVIIWVVSGLVPWRSLISQRFATAVAFERAFGSPLLVRLIILAAVLSLLKIFNANFLTASRLIFALGRRGMIPAAMGTVHPRFQSPTSAVLFCAGVTLCLSLMGESILIPVTEVGSLCSALGWLVTCLAFVRWRRTQPTGASVRTDIVVACVGVAVALSLLLLKILPFIPGSFRRWEYVSLAAWLLLGMLLRRKPA